MRRKPRADTMKLVVGLGNPGRKYNGTRHNVGFEVLARLAQRYDVGRPKAKFSAEVAETIIRNQKTMLLSPLTYMNLSGQSVRAAVDFYKLPLTDLLVICDDINLDVARLRSGQVGPRVARTDLKTLSNDWAARRSGGCESVLVVHLPIGTRQILCLANSLKRDQSEIDSCVARGGRCGGSLGGAGNCNGDEPVQRRSQTREQE